MKPRPPRLPSAIMKELDGLPWTMVRGARHWRLLIDGIQVGVFSSDVSVGDLRSTQNMRARIRRFKRQRLAA